MLFSPISEIHLVGRNPPYLISFIIYFVVSVILAAVANESFAGCVVLRVLQGFFGSPFWLRVHRRRLGSIYRPILLHTVGCGHVLRPSRYVQLDCSGKPAERSPALTYPPVAPTLAAWAVSDNWRWPLWEIVFLRYVT